MAMDKSNSTLLILYGRIIHLCKIRTNAYMIIGLGWMLGYALYVSVVSERYPKVEQNYGFQQQKEKTIYTSDIKNRHDNRTRVILHAKWRTGSTYSSMFFNMHKSAYYIFEPLRLLEFDGTMERGIQNLRYMLNCNFTANMKHPIIPWYPRYIFCHPGDHTPGCPAVNYQVAEETCKKASMVVVKEIRVEKLQYILPLIEEGVKIIQIVRDPRGVTQSRIDEAIRNDQYDDNNEKLYVDMLHYCDSILFDGLYAKQTHIIHRSHIFIRYEDMVLAPRESTSKIYNFLGHDPDESLTKWMDEQVKHLARNKDDKDIWENPLGTERRTPAKIPERWRLTLNLRQVRVVQEACKPMMKMLGYKTLTTLHDLHNQDSSMIGPMPQLISNQLLSSS